MKRRILFVTNNYRPYSGGVVSSIDASVDELRKCGHDVYIVCPQFLAAHPEDPKYVIRLPSMFRFMYRQNHMAILWRPHHYLAQLCDSFKPTIIHVHHPFLLGPIAVACAKKCAIKTVFTYHTMYEAYAHYVPAPRWITTPLIEKMVLRFCKTVDHIVAPSCGIQQRLFEQNISAVTVVPSGLRSEFCNQPFRRKILSRPYQLLYVGRFVPEKNVPFLIDVLAQLPKEYRLTLVGYGSDTEGIKQYAYGVRNLSYERITFIIKPNVQALCDAYEQAHLFLFPSQTDTQGLVLAESMAFSTPVVALDGVGQKDLVLHGRNGFFVQIQKEMAYVVQRVCNDEHGYYDLQLAAWKTAQEFTAAAVTQRLVGLYEQLHAQYTSFDK